MFGYPQPIRSIYNQPYVPYPPYSQPMGYPMPHSIYSQPYPQYTPYQPQPQYFNPVPSTHSIRGYTSRINLQPPPPQNQIRSPQYLSSPSKQTLQSPTRTDFLRPSGFLSQPQQGTHSVRSDPQGLKQTVRGIPLQSQQVSGQKQPLRQPQPYINTPQHQPQSNQNPRQQKPVPQVQKKDKQQEKPNQKQQQQNQPDDLEKRFAEALQRTKNIIERHNRQSQDKNKNGDKSPLNDKSIDQEDNSEELALQYDDGYIYHGQGFPPQTRHGYGILTDAERNEVYAGNWRNNLYDGQGRLNNLQQQKFDGQFEWTDMAQIGDGWAGYEGEFKEGKMHGKGVLFLTNGEKYVGEFHDGMIHGSGEFHTIDNQKVRGIWEEGAFIQEQE